MEGAGEDPYLGSRVVEVSARLSGRRPGQKQHLAACVKHYAAADSRRWARLQHGRYERTTTARNGAATPFEAAAKAGSATFMNAFNTLNGVPASMNKHLVTDILRGEWGWKGMVVSD
ncbi:MAG: hypothetical protein IPK76_22070 [Lewinellaceae bacterium]|nr:hypothetical protein [Lewinellaceae bacterium]